jgi:hypothetical protein
MTGANQSKLDVSRQAVRCAMPLDPTVMDAIGQGSPVRGGSLGPVIDHPIQWIEAGSLAYLLCQAGHDISRDQLARWHRAGLLPKPATKPLGRGRGTASLYPAIAYPQALALAELLKRDRHFPSVGWGLWWRGYGVGDAHWRTRLATSAATLDKMLPRLKAILAPPDDATDRQTDKAAELLRQGLDLAYVASNAPPIFKRMRKALGKERFDQFVAAMLEMAVGAFDGLSAKPDLYDPDRVQAAKVLDIGLGFKNARLNAPPGARPWLDGDIGEVLKEVSALMAKGDFAGMLATKSDTEIMAARNQLTAVMEIGAAMARLTFKAYGGDAFGFKRLLQIVEHYDGEAQAHILLAWIKMQPAFCKRADAFIEKNGFIVEMEAVINKAPIPEIPYPINRSTLAFPYDEAKSL